MGFRALLKVHIKLRRTSQDKGFESSGTNQVYHFPPLKHQRASYLPLTNLSQSLIIVSVCQQSTMILTEYTNKFESRNGPTERVED